MRGRWCAAVGLGALAALPSAWVRARSSGRVRTLADVPATEAALVLGAGVRRDGLPSRILQGRLVVALRLFRAGRVRWILVSGSPRSRGYSEPVVMRDFLLRNGVPAAAIALDESGVDTWASCRSAVAAFGLRQVTVATSKFHLRRSIALCRRAGIDAFGVGHDAAADGLRRVSARGARREFLAVTKAFWFSR
ncbi:YdcF family protein [Saccharopolyspora sp. NFXS83]|uniref:SanA/YdcF family protein n=1 Tax=Saccharopolyspora sp. NFXS83 TaxID=2993560 RepID=UPI00224B6804|nr:YdcF family protein [Saccharopolyspora sp. NFXS83]MCX2734201.1 YdcF family protein [Saccharopolyspora sp. NFXS83]